MNKKATLSTNTYYSLICNVCGQICTALACPQNAWGNVFSIKSLRIAAIKAAFQHVRENPVHRVRMDVRKATGKILAEEEKDEQCSSV